MNIDTNLQQKEASSLIVIPTYNERVNVRQISEKILSLYPSIHILFVDDNSPDGTGDAIEQLRETYPGINVLHREGKLGLGTAYIAGFRWALEREYEYIFEMDCDFSHDPKYIAAFLHVISNADLVLGYLEIHPGQRLNVLDANLVYLFDIFQEINFLFLLFEP